MLGRLKKIELREIWTSEAQDFTPWLAREDNLALLGEALDLELELDGQEVSVGPFRADILCTNLADGSRVLVENQLERTDHTHLGQLMAYAAGLQSVTIVWIAAKFQDDHRAALDWLNKITDDQFRFFGLEVELWRSGDSPAAPKFNIVSKPNDWSRSYGKSATRADPTGRLSNYQRFWTGFVEHVAERSSTVRPQSPRMQHWMNFAIGRSGFQLTAMLSAQRGEIGVGLETTMDSKDAFDALYAKKEAIEEALGFAPVWQRLDGKKMTRIVFVKEESISDEANWPKAFEWIDKTLVTFDSALRDRIKKI